MGRLLLIWRLAAAVDRHQETHDKTSEKTPAAVSSPEEIVAAAGTERPGLLPGRIAGHHVCRAAGV